MTALYQFGNDLQIMDIVPWLSHGVLPENSFLKPESREPPSISQSRACGIAATEISLLCCKAVSFPFKISVHS